MGNEENVPRVLSGLVGSLEQPALPSNRIGWLTAPEK
jgi:hypothetical protein